MATINRFEDIVAWQKARELSKKVYSVSSKGDFSKDFDLKSQIRRSSGSVMDNIAEGFGRGGNREFIQFLGFSRGSVNETKSQLYRAKDQNYFDQITFENLYNNAEEISKMIDSLTGYLTQTEIKGRKFAKSS